MDFVGEGSERREMGGVFGDTCRIFWVHFCVIRYLILFFIFDFVLKIKGGETIHDSIIMNRK